MIRKLFLLLLIPAGAVAADAGEIPARQDGVVGDPVERYCEEVLDNPDVLILLGKLTKDPAANAAMARFSVDGRLSDADVLLRDPEVGRVVGRDPRDRHVLKSFVEGLGEAVREGELLVAANEGQP